jgi:glutathione S-transferase
MAKLKLTYFDFHGGRGEAARMALSIGGVDFEDDRISFSEFSRRKSEFPFGAVPVLQVDGRVVSQSNGINRYVGKLVGLYPSDPWEAALCDEAMDAIEDIGHKIQATFDLPDADKKPRRQALADGPLTFFLTRFQQRLEAHGGQHFAGDSLSMADLKVFVWIRYLKSGTLDHVPTDIPDRVAPLLVEHFHRVKNHPAIKAYYAKHGIPD